MQLGLIAKGAFLLVVVTFSFAPGGAQGPPKPTSARLRPDLAVNYSYLRSNAPPNRCGCFNLNGGSITFAWPIATTPLALVGDVMAAHASGIAPYGYDLTLSAYTAGVRYRPRIDRWPVQTFGQVLIGVAHSSGTLVKGQYSVASNANAAFAANVGGGVDVRAGRRFSLRLVQVDYLLTTIDNGSNDRQNNLRVSAGAVIHF